MDDLIQRILERGGRVAVVGMSRDPSKPSHTVPVFLAEHGFEVVPVNPAAEEIAGLRTAASLSEVPGPIDVVQVFRRSEDTPAVVRDAVAAGARAVWLQLGIASAESRAIAAEAGLEYVEDACMKVEVARRGIDHAG